MPEVIRFYGPDEPFGSFSNFSRHSVLVFGLVWMTSEHAFQAMKSLNPEERQRVRAQPTPGKAFREGHKISIRPDWDNIVPETNLILKPDTRFKDIVMYSIVLEKFRQNQEIKLELLRTNDAHIIEAAPRDSYWGEGGNQTGLNKLGQILMLVRSKILESPV